MRCYAVEYKLAYQLLTPEIFCFHGAKFVNASDCLLYFLLTNHYTQKSLLLNVINIVWNLRDVTSVSARKAISSGY